MFEDVHCWTEVKDNSWCPTMNARAEPSTSGSVETRDKSAEAKKLQRELDRGWVADLRVALAALANDASP